jgi:hypothetical protein
LMTEDWEKASQHNWSLDSGPWNTYARTMIPHPEGGWRMYSDGRRRRRTTGMRLHRFLMSPPPGYMVDHINHNGLDNRRENLRICTRVENGRNRLPSKKSASGYKGVVKTSRGCRWQAKINIDKKQTYIGSFATAEEAARAYDAKAIEVFGEYANLNFPEEHNRKENK